MASGHSAEFPFGTRLVIPGDNDCNAIAPAGGFVSTAADVARFFAQLDPDARKSILSPASRREMMHRHRRDSGSNIEQHYGFGTMIGAPGPKEWFGHTGSLQGFVSRTARFSASGLTVTVLCNANDGASYPWVDSLISILTTFRQYGAPGKREAAWAGRWWNMWGASDLVPMGKVVCQVVPGLNPPFDGNNTEITVKGKDHGVVSKTSAYNHPGEGVRRVRDGKGLPSELWIGSSRLVPKDAMLAEVVPRYVKAPAALKPAPKAPSRRGADGRGVVRGVLR
jgi:D-alanyl-D-alanine carboxypeptidase